MKRRKVEWVRYPCAEIESFDEHMYLDDMDFGDQFGIDRMAKLELMAHPAIAEWLQGEGNPRYLSVRGELLDEETTYLAETYLVTKTRQYPFRVGQTRKRAIVDLIHTRPEFSLWANQAGRRFSIDNALLSYSLIRLHDEIVGRDPRDMDFEFAVPEHIEELLLVMGKAHIMFGGGFARHPDLMKMESKVFTTMTGIKADHLYNFGGERVDSYVMLDRSMRGSITLMSSVPKNTFYDLSVLFESWANMIDKPSKMAGVLA